MRGLAACLAGFLALGALGAMVATMSACSDSTDASGGAGGATAAGGSHSGGSSTSGGGSSSGGSDSSCGFASDACNQCLTAKCEDETNACAAADTCLADLLKLPNCVCNPANDVTMCIHDFVVANGDPANKLAECYSLNCETECK